MIIGMTTLKGGVGKTTLTLNIAHALSQDSRVLVIDSDPQQSALNWSSSRDEKPEFSVIGLPTKTIHRDIKDLSKDYDHIIIDSPPRVTDIARSVIVSSDIVLIPATPCVFSVWALEETVGLIEESFAFKEGTKYGVVINRRSPTTVISKELVEKLKEKEMNLINSTISERVIFSNASLQGKTIFEIQKNDDAKKVATQEIKDLIIELKEMMND